MSEEKKETTVEFKEKASDKAKAFAKRNWKRAVAGAAILGAAVGGFLLGRGRNEAYFDETTEPSSDIAEIE